MKIDKNNTLLYLKVKMSIYSKYIKKITWNFINQQLNNNSVSQQCVVNHIAILIITTLGDKVREGGNVLE